MTALLSALGGAAAALVLVALVGFVRGRRRARVDLEEALDAALGEIDQLRLQRDDALAQLADLRAESHGPVTGEPAPPARRRRPVPTARTAQPVETAPDFVITAVGQEPGWDQPPVEVPDRIVLSAALGVPLVKTAAFAHGLRRALSAQTRNRIRFEMRQEVKAARKRRRRQAREQLRDFRARERAQEAT